MIHPELYPILTYNQKVYFSITFVIIFFIISIIIKLKNKAKKCKKQAICKKDVKMLNPEDFISNYNKFIAQNTKNMYLFEIKEFKKIVDQEILNMILKEAR